MACAEVFGPSLAVSLHDRGRLALGFGFVFATACFLLTQPKPED